MNLVLSWANCELVILSRIVRPCGRGKQSALKAYSLVDSRYAFTNQVNFLINLLNP